MKKSSTRISLAAMMAVVVLAFTSQPVSSAICQINSQIHTFNINVGGPYQTTIGSRKLVSVNPCTNTVVLYFNGSYANSEKKTNLLLYSNGLKAAVTYDDDNYTEYTASGRALVRQSVFVVNGSTSTTSLANRSAYTDKVTATFRCTKSPTPICMGNVTVRVDEQTINGYYWEPLIAELWFR